MRSTRVCQRPNGFLSRKKWGRVTARAILGWEWPIVPVMSGELSERELLEPISLATLGVVDDQAGDDLPRIDAARSDTGAFSSPTLSGLFHKYGHVRCAQFGLRQGARARVYPLRYSTDRATPPQAKFGATLRAAVLFRPDFVARALQTAAGMLVARASSGRKTLAANVTVF